MSPSTMPRAKRTSCLCGALPINPRPFRGLWRHLTTWNVIEFKGPSVAVPFRYLNLLVELGLGIDRRLNEERRRQRQTTLEAEQASFGYVVNRLGRRFLTGARHRMGLLDEIEAGLWRSQILGHLVSLVRIATFASEPDSVPLHLLIRRSAKQERELAHLVVDQPHYFEWFGKWLGTLHPNVWREVREMARKSKGIPLDFSAMRDDIDIGEVLESLGIERIMGNGRGEKNVQKNGQRRRSRLADR